MFKNFALLSSFLLAIGVQADELFKGKYVVIPSTGVINQTEGTVELTVKPEKPVQEFENEWSFALAMTPAMPIGQGGRNILGIYSSAGEELAPKGIYTIIRNDAEKAFRTKCSLETALTQGKRSNIALSWGPAGTILYVNGKKLSSDSFSGRIDPFPAEFLICAGPPFFVEAARISTAQLDASKLDSTPEDGFTADADTSLIGSDKMQKTTLKIPQNLKNTAILLPEFSFNDSFAKADEKCLIKFRGSNFKDKILDCTIKMKIKDIDGKDLPVKTSKISMPPASQAQEYIIDPELTETGFYDIEMEISIPGEKPVKRTLSRAVLPPEDKGLSDGKFAQYIGHHLFDIPQVPGRAGIRWTRNDAFHWYIVEPEKGKFDWRWTDRILAADEAAGLQTLALLGTPPVWAADTEIKKGHKNSTMAGRRKPANIKDWENYITQVATRYKGRIKYWEIGNEMDFHPPATPASFSGTTEEYFEMLKTAYNAIKKIDPEAKVLVCGFGHGALCDRNMPYDLLKMGAANYCDYYNIHSYQGLWGIDKLLAAVNAAKPGMKMWQSEQMWHTIADKKMQARLTVAIHFWFMERGFEKYFNFGEDFFFSLYSLSPEPVFQTLALMQNLLRKCSGFEGVINEGAAKNYELRHIMKRTDGTYLTVLGRSSAPAVYKFKGDVKEVSDIYGRKIPFTAKNGLVTTGRAEEIIFVVSNGKLSAIEDEMAVANLCPNGSFEEITGDVATGGLKSAAASKWQLREKTYDKDGEISVTEEAYKGKYALQLSSSGKGRVYAFFETPVPGGGKYVISAFFKNKSDKPISPYIDVFERTTNYFKRYKLDPVQPGSFAKRSAEVEIPQTDAPMVFCAGLEAAGSIIIDEFSLMKADMIEREGLESISLKSSKPVKQSLSGKKSVDVEMLVKNTAGKKLIKRIPFEISEAPILLSKENWSGIEGEKIVIPLTGKAKSAALLLASAYVPATAFELAKIRFIYADGSGSAAQSIENKRDLRDWFLAGDLKGIVPDYRFVSSDMLEFGLFVVELKNPAPSKELKAIEIQSMGESLLMLPALSMER